MQGKKVFIKILKWLGVLTTFFITIYFLNLLLKLDILPVNYLIYIIMSFLFLDTLLFFFTIIKEKIISSLGFLLASILLVTSLYGIYFCNTTINFLEVGFNNVQTSSTIYKVIVLNNANLLNLNDLTNKKVGFLSTELEDKYLDVLMEEVKIGLVAYDDLYNMYNALKEAKLDAFIIDDAYLNILANDYDLKSEVKTLYSFAIEKETILEEKPISTLKPLNIYISGSDARSNTVVLKSLTDVNMIVSINPESKEVLITSIPRDYYVKINSTNGLNDKLTHSGIYGVETSLATLEDLFDIKIDYYIKVGFNSLVNLVDLIGGVDIVSDIAFNDGSLQVQTGLNHFNGAQALNYARERHAYTSGDRHRILNQQQVLEAILKKIMTNKSLLLKYDELLQAFSSLYITDIPSDLVVLFIKSQLTNMSSWHILTQTVDGKDAYMKTYTVPSRELYVMIPNESDVAISSDKIKTLLGLI